MTYDSSPGKYDENEAFPLMFFSKVRFGFRSMCVHLNNNFIMGKARLGHIKFILDHIKKILAKQVFLCFFANIFF